MGVPSAGGTLASLAKARPGQHSKECLWGEGDQELYIAYHTKNPLLTDTRKQYVS